MVAGAQPSLKRRWKFYSTGIYFLIGDLGKLQFGGIDWKIRPG